MPRMHDSEFIESYRETLSELNWLYIKRNWRNGYGTKKKELFHQRETGYARLFQSGKQP